MGAESASTTVTFVGVNLSDMQAAPTAIFANGTETSDITIKLRDKDGATVGSEKIDFVTDLGTLAASSATTNTDGVATVTITAPTSTGTATITARYGLLSATTTVIFSSPVPVGIITLAASPANHTSGWLQFQSDHGYPDRYLGFSKPKGYARNIHHGPRGLQ